jgi:ferritin-like metal-binding protein YciE
MTAKLDSMRTLYLEQLRDLHSAETQLVEALPKAAKAAHNGDLKSAIREHLEVTKGHVARLDDILGQMEEGPGRTVCKGMAGLIKEASEAIEADGDPRVRDAAIIAAAQRIEHYEIAGYGCAATFADLLKDSQAAGQLRTTLSEERETNDALTELAEGSINIEAAGGVDTESSTADGGEDQKDKRQHTGTPMRRQSRARSGG